MKLSSQWYFGTNITWKARTRQEDSRRDSTDVKSGWLYISWRQQQAVPSPGHLKCLHSALSWDASTYPLSTSNWAMPLNHPASSWPSGKYSGCGSPLVSRPSVILMHSLTCLPLASMMDFPLTSLIATVTPHVFYQCIWVWACPLSFWCPPCIKVYSTTLSPLRWVQSRLRVRSAAFRVSFNSASRQIQQKLS